jgi:hypothetical protein
MKRERLEYSLESRVPVGFGYHSGFASIFSSLSFRHKQASTLCSQLTKYPATSFSLIKRRSFRFHFKKKTHYVKFSVLVLSLFCVESATSRYTNTKKYLLRRMDIVVCLKRVSRCDVAIFCIGCVRDAHFMVNLLEILFSEFFHILIFASLLFVTYTNALLKALRKPLDRCLPLLYFFVVSSNSNFFRWK